MSGLIFFASSFIVTSLILYRESKRNASIAELWLYPIKSCGGIKVSKALVGQRGFVFDRIFMIVDSDNKFVSQRTQPSLALVKMDIDEITEKLTISAPGMSTKLVINLKALPVEEAAVDCTVWGEAVTANVIDGGEWFSKFLGSDFNLVRMAENCVRPTDPAYAPDGQAAFSDGFAFLLASQNSLKSMNRKLAKPVTMANFRPNIVADGCSAYAEDTWNLIEFKSQQPIAMNVVKPCSRCKIPSIDPLTGIFDPNNEPTRTIKKFRSGEALGMKNKSWKGEVFFGQNLDHKGQRGVVLSVGDKIRIKSFQKF